MRTNRKSNPKEVVSSKLKKGETFSLRNSNNVMVLKWKDKRDLLICSTKDTNNMVTVVKRQKITKKPEAIINYNKGKGSIDLADQRASFSNPLRTTLKWYRKVFIDVILNVSVVNSLCLFNKVTQSNISITHFRELLVEFFIKKTTII